MYTSYKKSNFGPAFFFLDKTKREALAAVYAFCREVDDIVDEPGADPAGALNFWRAEIERIYSAQTPQSALGLDLKKYIEEFKMDKGNFLLLIDGMEMDLNRRQYDDFNELQEYLYRAASVVGLMCCEIFGVPRAEGELYAVTLGYGVQMTNIIRDIYADSDMGRIYLPAEEMRKFQVSSYEIESKNTAALAPLLEFEGQRAKEFFAKAKSSLPPAYDRALLSARIMGALYEAILDKIAKQKFVFTSKVSLTKFEKIIVIIKALIA